RMRVHQPAPVQIRQHRPLHPDEQIELDHDDEADDDAHDDGRQRPDDPPPQLLEVIEEGHLGRATHRQLLACYLPSVRSCSRASAASSEHGYSRTIRSSEARAAAFWPADLSTSARL